MEVSYDRKTDTLSVILRDDAAVVESHEDKPGVILDYDAKEGASSLRDRLHALATLLPSIESPEFSPGHRETPPPLESGIKTFPMYWFSEAARLLDDPACLAEATPEQLAHLLTGLIRSERFNEGTLAGAFDSGLIARILRRATVLEEELGRDGRARPSR